VIAPAQGYGPSLQPAIHSIQKSNVIRVQAIVPTHQKPIEGLNFKSFSQKETSFDF
jgi:hypothetical protein